MDTRSNIERKLRWMNHKYYFDHGVGLTSLLIKILAVVGIAAALQGTNKQFLFIFGLFYGVFCYIIGRIYVRCGWLTAYIEVENRLNLFMKEVRTILK